MLSDMMIDDLRHTTRADLKAMLETLAETHGSSSVHASLSLLAAKDAPIKVPVLMDAGVFLTTLGERPPDLVQGLLCENQLILLTGKPKHGKSFLALAMGLDIAAGRDVCGEYTVNRAGTVIYFSMEDPLWTLGNRLMCHGVVKDQQTGLIICTERFNLGSPEAIDAMRELVAGYAPVLVILDTASQALGIKDWANKAEIENKLAPLRDFAHEVCTVLLVAHNRKAAGENGDEIAGTNAFTAGVDGWFSAKDKKTLANGNLRVAYTLDGRDIRGEMLLEMDTDTLEFRAVSKEEWAQEEGESGDGPSKVERKRFAAFANAIADAGGEATSAQIAGGSGISVSTFSRLMRRMMAAGHLRETGKFVGPAGGGSGRQSPLYAVPNDSDLFATSPIPKVSGVITNNPPSSVASFFEDKYAQNANNANNSPDEEAL